MLLCCDIVTLLVFCENVTMNRERIELSKREIQRSHVVAKMLEGGMTVKEAAESMGLSERQTKRLKARMKGAGELGLIHRNRGRKPKHTISEQVKRQIIEFATGKYAGTNIMHLRDLLEERDNIVVSRSSVSRILAEHGILADRKRRKCHRSRDRRKQFGMLVQIDASPYQWLGGNTLLSLHGAIDDSTGKVLGLWIARTECLDGYFELMERVIRHYGCPMALYADRHTIFQENNITSDLSEHFSGQAVPLTQFQRALSELGIELIAAHSPQAKGRVERLWKTLQSRLPIELRLAGIETIEKTNEFLQGYCAKFNRKFAVKAETPGSACHPLKVGQSLRFIFCRKSFRMVDSGGCFSFKNQRYQPMDSGKPSQVLPRTAISVLYSSHIGVKAQYNGKVFSVRPISSPVRSSAADA